MTRSLLSFTMLLTLLITPIPAKDAQTAATMKASPTVERAYPLSTGNRTQFYTRSGQVVGTDRYLWVESLSDTSSPIDDQRGYIGCPVISSKIKPTKAAAWNTCCFITAGGVPRPERYLHFDTGYREPPGFLLGRTDDSQVLLDPITGEPLLSPYASVRSVDDTLERFLVRASWDEPDTALVDIHGGTLAQYPYEVDRFQLRDGTRVLYGQKRDPKTGETRMSLIDARTGTPITGFDYASLYGSDDGIRLAAQNIDGKFALIDKRGREITPYIYDGIAAEGDHYTVIRAKESGVLDADGNTVLPMAAGDIIVQGDFLIRNQPGMARVYDRTGKEICKDTSGVGIIAVGRRNAPHTEPSLYLRLTDNGKPRYLDRNGKREAALDGLYVGYLLKPDVAQAFENDYATNPRYMGLRRLDGTWLIPPKYNHIELREDVPTPYYAATVQGRTMCFDLRGKPMNANPRYERRVIGDVYEAAYGMTYGLVDGQGKWIVQRSRFDELMD